MKKMKKIFAAIAASFVLFVGTASAVTPEDIFLNYGGGLGKGDSIVKATVALPWTMLSSDGSWVLPTFMGEYEYCIPLGPVPFSFGGYAGMTGYGGSDWGNFVLTAGGSATYHIAVPPVPALDINVGLKLGLKAVIGSNSSFGFDPGFNVGVSYFFNDKVGITTDIGYPSFRIGAIFKL